MDTDQSSAQKLPVPGKANLPCEGLPFLKEIFSLLPFSSSSIFFFVFHPRTRPVADSVVEHAVRLVAVVVVAVLSVPTEAFRGA